MKKEQETELRLYSLLTAPPPVLLQIGPNIRFFLENHVRGIFEEGDYWSAGGELQELKSWLMLQLLYNPAADDQALIAEFLAGFYGNITGGAAVVSSYMSLVAQSFADTGGVLLENVSPNMAYLTPRVVLQAVAMLAAAAQSAPAPFAGRLLTLWLAPTYVALLRWDEFKAWAVANGVTWPLAATPQLTFATFSSVYASAGMGAGALSEGGHGLAWLQSQLPPSLGEST